MVCRSTGYLRFCFCSRKVVWLTYVDEAARVASVFQDVSHFVSANQRAQVVVDLE